MLAKAFVPKVGIMSEWLGVIGEGMYAYSSSWPEQTQYLYVFWIHKLYKVFHYYVNTILVEGAMIPETEQVDLQAFTLHQPVSGYISYYDLGEIGLSGYGTKGSELGAIKFDPIIVFGMFISECLENIGGIMVGIIGFVSKGFKGFVGYVIVYVIAHILLFILNIL